MPRENIISGGLEGDGIEGHKKRIKDKSLSDEPFMSAENDERREKGTDDPFETGFGAAKPERKVAKETPLDQKKDIFETDFGSVHSTKKYHGSSSIGSSSDIFSNGFGSKDAGWMSGRGRKAVPAEQHHEVKKAPATGRKETGDIFETGIAKHPLDADEALRADVPSSDKQKERDDPFYTGFGYTDQRKQKEIPQKGIKPELKKSAPAAKTEDAGKKKHMDEDDDDLFT